jgi:hypothetical protein
VAAAAPPWLLTIKALPREVSVDELVVYERNPRRMRPERKEQFLKTLMAERELTEARPVIARRSDKV